MPRIISMPLSKLEPFYWTFFMLSSVHICHFDGGVASLDKRMGDPKPFPLNKRKKKGWNWIWDVRGIFSCSVASPTTTNPNHKIGYITKIGSLLLLTTVSSILSIPNHYLTYILEKKYSPIILPLWLLYQKK